VGVEEEELFEGMEFFISSNEEFVSWKR
jgi:hypothetical protein